MHGAHAYQLVETNCGGIAQLGERLLCKQEVIGSIPFASTNDIFFWKVFANAQRFMYNAELLQIVIASAVMSVL